MRSVNLVKCNSWFIQTLREKCLNTGKYGPEKTPYLDTFHAMKYNNVAKFPK